VPPSRRDLRCDLTSGDRVVARVIELPDRSERDREIAVRTHARETACDRTGESGCVMTCCRPRIGKPHREMTKRHRHGHTPGAVFDALRHVLRKAKRGLRLLHAIETELELCAREVHVELLTKAGASRGRRQRAGCLPELGLRVIGASIDRAQDRAFDREPRHVERVP
jgi:hypothetical protein